MSRSKRRVTQAFGAHSPSSMDMESYNTEDAAKDFDEDDDAKADEEMDDERGQRPQGPGRPVQVRVPLDPENTDDRFSESQLRKHLEENSDLVGMFEVICQGSVGKLRQLVDRLLWRHDFEGFAIKAAVFGRVKAAIDLLKPPPTGYQLFADRRRTELSEDADGPAENDIQKKIGDEWRALDEKERGRQRAHGRKESSRQAGRRRPRPNVAATRTAGGVGKLEDDVHDDAGVRGRDRAEGGSLMPFFFEVPFVSVAHRVPSQCPGPAHRPKVPPVPLRTTLTHSFWFLAAS